MKAPKTWFIVIATTLLFLFALSPVWSNAIEVGSPSAAKNHPEPQKQVRNAQQNPAAVLYFPFCQANATDFTGIAVSNYSSSAAHLQFQYFTLSGTSPLSTASYTIAPGEQFSKLSFEIFKQPAGTVQSGWIQLTSDNPEIGGLFQFGSNAQLDGSVPFREIHPNLTFTRVFQGSTAFRGQRAETWISLANPTSEAAKVKLTLHISGGSTPLSITRNIPGRGGLYASVATLFGAGPNYSSAYIRAEVTEGNGIVGFELIKLPSRNTVIGLNAQPDHNSKHLYSAQLAVLNGIFTNLKLVNPGSSAIQATIEAVDNDGNPLAASVQRTIAAGGMLEQEADQLFGWSSSQTAVGSVRIETDSPGLAGDVIFGDSLSQGYAAALPMQTQGFNRAIFSQVANSFGYYTGLALFNPGSQPATLTLRIYSNKGEKTGVKELVVNPGERTSKLLPEWLPATGSQMGGYVEIRSTQEFIGQQFFGSGNLLSAVPPTEGRMAMNSQGIAVTLPPDSSQDLVGLDSTPASNVLESGETAVSGAVQVSLSGLEMISSAQPLKVDFPLNTSSVDPAKLMAKVKLTSGHVLPVYGEYDSSENVYSVYLSGLFDGWEMGVVSGKLPKRVVSAADHGEPTDRNRSPNPLQWPTTSWIGEDFTTSGDLTQDMISKQLLPTLDDIGQKYEAAGFRAPRVWIDNKLGVPHVYFVEEGGASFYAPCPNGECGEQERPETASTQVAKQALYLGSIYIDYKAFQESFGAAGIGINYVLAHELFHAVQAGYDYKSGADSGYLNLDWGTATSYEEGTANLMGMTYLRSGGSVTTANVSVTEEFHFLDKPLGDFTKSSPYSKQDFFAFLVRRYFSSEGPAYLGDLWESLAAASDVAGAYDLPVEDLLQIYREGLDNFLKNRGLSLPQAYFEYAFERAYNHDPLYLLRSSEKGDEGWFQRHLLNQELFSSNTVLKQWEAEGEEPATFDPVDFSNLKPMSAVAVRMKVPEEYRGKSLPLQIVLTGGELKTVLEEEGVSILIFLEDQYRALSANAFVNIEDLDNSVSVPISEEVRYLSILIFNCYVSNTPVSVSLDVRDTLDLKPAVLNGEPGVAYTFTVPLSSLSNPPATLEYRWDMCGGDWASSGGSCAGEKPNGSKGIPSTRDDNNKLDYLYTLEGTFTPKVRVYNYDAPPGEQNTPIAEFQGKAIIQSKTEKRLDMAYSNQDKWRGADSPYSGSDILRGIAIAANATGPNFVDFEFRSSSKVNPSLVVWIKLSGHVHRVQGSITANIQKDGKEISQWIWYDKYNGDHWMEYTLADCQWEITDSRVDRDNPSTLIPGRVWNLDVAFDPSTDFGDSWGSYIQAICNCSLTKTEKKRDEKGTVQIIKTTDLGRWGPGQGFTIQYYMDY